MDCADVTGRRGFVATQPWPKRCSTIELSKSYKSSHFMSHRQMVVIDVMRYLSDMRSPSDLLHGFDRRVGFVL